MLLTSSLFQLHGTCHTSYYHFSYKASVICEANRLAHPKPFEMAANRQERIVDTFDHTNIDEFFGQPSAQELEIASEHHVQGIMADLNRRTLEELRSWSHGSYTESPQHRKHGNLEYSAEADMVSSLIHMPSRTSTTLLTD